VTIDELKKRARGFEWYHTIDLGQGVKTAGQYDLTPIIQHYGIPDSLKGKSILDVGPGHGFFTFEFEKRGAARVATVELPSWKVHDASPIKRQTIDTDDHEAAMEAYLRGALGFAIEARGARVDRLFHNVYDITPQNIGLFDIVFCASVLLHLSDPLRALYAIRTVTREHAIICTGIDMALHVQGQARALFMGTANGQAFWFPTIFCLEQMAIAAGFRKVERVSTFHVKSVDGKFDTPHGTIRAFV
jgi:tRNA (mo5U34)-methyltransferase